MGRKLLGSPMLPLLPTFNSHAPRLRAYRACISLARLGSKNLSDLPPWLPRRRILSSPDCQLLINAKNVPCVCGNNKFQYACCGWQLSEEEVGGFLE